MPVGDRKENWIPMGTQVRFLEKVGSNGSCGNQVNENVVIGNEKRNGTC